MAGARLSFFVLFATVLRWVAGIPVGNGTGHPGGAGDVETDKFTLTRTTAVCRTKTLPFSNSNLEGLPYTRTYTTTHARTNRPESGSDVKDSVSLGRPSSTLGYEPKDPWAETSSPGIISSSRSMSARSSSAASLRGESSGVWSSSHFDESSVFSSKHDTPSASISLYATNSHPLNGTAASQTPTLSLVPLLPSQSSEYSSVLSSTELLNRKSPTVPFGTPTPPSFASPNTNQLPPNPITTTMGESKTKKSASPPKTSGVQSWLETLRDKISSHGHTTTASSSIPEDNIFVPIQADNILPQIPIGRHHPVPRKGIEDTEERTLHTNKFYANTFLGGQDMPVWTHPYSLWWGKGHNGQFETWGMNVGHIDADDVVMSPGDPPQFYMNPPRRQGLILSARELGPATTLSTDTHLPFSVNINLNADANVAEPTITFPVVQGMSFITGGYRNATPIFQCPGAGFVSISGPTFVGKSTKYRLSDSAGKNWVAYINPVPTIKYDTTAFAAIDANTFAGPSGFKGTIQIAKNPSGSEVEALYDKATGAFVSEATITASVNEMRGTYSLMYTKIGSSPLLMFVLPHHIQSLDPDLKNKVTKLQLRTTTKGMATAVWGDTLTFIEPNLPTTMGFGPWNAAIGATKLRYTPPTLDTINTFAEHDLGIAMAEKTPEDSMYYAGKTLSKLATIVWVLKEVTSNPAWTSGLTKLKTEMARYIENRQKYALFYDDSWKGLVSNSGFNNPGADFGNTYYNDHHFHYGYFVYACAVIASLEPEWLAQGDNKAWCNSLVKDYAESDYKGRDYPFSRSFDWYHGHSWANGLFESANGKDEESTSEDGFASLALKLWGKAIGDVNMEKRGNLMLAIQARTFNNYFYLQSNNANHPARFIPNGVSGILFENKVDYTTYFGSFPELIHGIHILPISPASMYLRAKPFVKEEWDHFFSNDRWRVDNGWRGILMANLAIVDPKSSWEFFKNGVNGEWNPAWIDNGASRSWYLVWAAGLGGAR